MKLRAIHPIKKGKKWIEPEKGFDASKEEAEELISGGFAELFSPGDATAASGELKQGKPEEIDLDPDPFKKSEVE
jgi:hypothetical protein